MSGNPATAAKFTRPPASFWDWVRAARLRTLPLAIAPVILGTGAGTAVIPAGQPGHLLRALLALGIALALQVGVNFANDYSDGIRGTDAHGRTDRLTGTGAAKPRTVLIVALAFLGLGAISGAVLTVRSGNWWFFGVGALALLAAWFYTGGKRPYGYAGFGELAAFLFFGPVATVCSAWIQWPIVRFEGLLSGIALGLLAAAVLLANNLRDLVTDRAVGKRTLAVRIGRTASTVLFVVFVLLPFGLVGFFSFFYPVYLTYFMLLPAIVACVVVLFVRASREYGVALVLVSVTALGYGALLGASFWGFPGVGS